MMGQEYVLLPPEMAAFEISVDWKFILNHSPMQAGGLFRLQCRGLCVPVEKIERKVAHC